MKIVLQCIPCFVRQAYEAVSLVSNDETCRKRILRQVLARLSTISFDTTPAYVGRDIHRSIRLLSGNGDPYLEIKRYSNTFAQQLMPSLKGLVKSSANPFETALRLAIAGNIIDCGQGNHINTHRINKTISQCLAQRIPKDRIDELREEIQKASNIMYLADNAGEVFFDKLFIEELNGYPITFVVRGAPIINDALKDDAKVAGIDTLLEVVDNGSDVPGTMLEECSEEFRRHFRQADLVIAKGQGNYETLSDEKKKIFFLLKAKCPVIAKHIGCQEGDMIIVKKDELVA